VITAGSGGSSRQNAEAGKTKTAPAGPRNKQSGRTAGRQAGVQIRRQNGRNVATQKRQE